MAYFFYLVLFIAIASAIPIIPQFLMESSSKYLRWGRKIMWNRTLRRYSSSLYSRNVKVEVYFREYLKKSVAAKLVYLDSGYDTFRYSLMPKVEEIERFVDKYKYNTFDNLDSQEELFIDNWLKKERRK
jgi:hypothetical protein